MQTVLGRRLRTLVPQNFFFMCLESKAECLSGSFNIVIHYFYLTAFLALSNLSFGHGEDGMEWEIHPLKDRIHHLCSGHGASHMTENELNELFNQFSENYQDILSLVGDANADNYAVQLTYFIERSDLEEKQKYSAYRDIYKKVNIEEENGMVWNRTLRKLVSFRDLLSEEELKNHLDTEDQVLTSQVQKKLSKMRREKNRDEKHLRDETRGNGSSKMIQTKEKESEKNKLNLTWVIVGILSVIFLFLLKIIKKNSNSKEI